MLSWNGKKPLDYLVCTTFMRRLLMNAGEKPQLHRFDAAVAAIGAAKGEVRAKSFVRALTVGMIDWHVRVGGAALKLQRIL